MIEHCIVYLKNRKEERAYKVNVTEMVRGLLGVITGKWEELPRFVDVLNPPEDKEEPTAEEIKARIRKKLGA